jgi:hypothetical protein
VCAAFSHRNDPGVPRSAERGSPIAGNGHGSCIGAGTARDFARALISRAVHDRF